MRFHGWIRAVVPDGPNDGTSKGTVRVPLDSYGMTDQDRADRVEAR